MPLTYPAPPPTVTGGTTIEVHHLLKTPSVLARRIRNIAERRYISDALLKGRFIAEGGAILYETGEPIETNDDPEAVAPGGAYPRSTADPGEVAAAKTTKWGRDVRVTDESIARLKVNVVDRALRKLVNRSVSFVDSATLGVIASKVTATYDVTGGGNPGAWTTAGPMIESILKAKGNVEDLGEGYEPDTIVLTSNQWAKAMTLLLAAGLLPREANNPLISGGDWPETLGLMWLYSPYTPAPNPMLLDTDQLGGMADENLGGPGYVREGGIGIETKSIRDEKHDAYDLRARRVTVPVVVEPAAGVFFTNTGLA